MVQIFLETFWKHPIILQPLGFFEILLTPLTLQTYQFFHIQKHTKKWGGNLISVQWNAATLNPTSFCLGRYPYSTTFQNLLSDFEAPNCPNNIPEDSRRLRIILYYVFFSPETNIPGIRFSGLIWRLSGVRLVFRYYQLNSSIHYIIYIILCHWTWPQISKYLLKEMWTHTNIMSLVALYLALLPSVHCTCAPRELFTPRDWAGSSIVADGVWVPGIGVPGVLRIQHLAKIFVGIHKCTKNHVQLVMSIVNIYIYLFIYLYVYIHSYGMIKCRTWPWGNAISFFNFSASCTWIPMDSSRHLHQKIRTCFINLLRVLLLNKHQIIKKTHTKQAKITKWKGFYCRNLYEPCTKPQAKIFWDECHPTTICPKSRPHVVEVLLHPLDLNIEIASYLDRFSGLRAGFLECFPRQKKKHGEQRTEHVGP